MEGRGRWLDNVMIEGLWRTLKEECVDLHAFETGSRRAQETANGSGFTTRSALIRRLVEGHRLRPIRART